MKVLPIGLLVFLMACDLLYAGDPVALPKGVPPVIGIALASNSPIAGDGENEEWTIRVMVPKIAWDVVGERRPKHEWPEFTIDVQEAVLTLSMAYHPATQLSESAQNRIVDLNGRRLTRAEACRYGLNGR